MWLQLVLTVLAGSSLAQAASTITDVRTAQQLEVAIKDGAEHIRIREHLDLRQLKLGPLCEDGGCAQLLLFKLADTTLSIQVRLHAFRIQEHVLPWRCPLVVRFSGPVRLGAALSIAGYCYAWRAHRLLIANEWSCDRIAHRYLACFRAFPGREFPIYLKACVQGACDSPVPPAVAQAAAQPPLEPLAAGQCVLLSKDRLLQFVGKKTNTWIDNLYMRLVWPKNSPATDFINLMGVDTAKVWFTNSTWQGDTSVPDARHRALDPWQNANIYFGGGCLRHAKLLCNAL